MAFTEIIYLVVFSIALIMLVRYVYDMIHPAAVSSNVIDEMDCTPVLSKEEYVGLCDDTLELPQATPPHPTNPDGTTPLGYNPMHATDIETRIPFSESSRPPSGGPLGSHTQQDMSILGDSGPKYEPVQMINPLPNDRLMPISGAKDDPIKTRLDSSESLGIYQHILEKDIGQTSSNTSNKNRYFEMGPRDSPYHLNGSAGVNAFDQQQAFNGAQPKHPNFDLGIQINYKKADQQMAVEKQKINQNLLLPYLA